MFIYKTYAIYDNNKKPNFGLLDKKIINKRINLNSNDKYKITKRPKSSTTKITTFPDQYNFNTFIKINNDNIDLKNKKSKTKNINNTVISPKKLTIHNPLKLLTVELNKETDKLLLLSKELDEKQAIINSLKKSIKLTKIPNYQPLTINEVNAVSEKNFNLRREREKLQKKITEIQSKLKQLNNENTELSSQIEKNNKLIINLQKKFNLLNKNFKIENKKYRNNIINLKKESNIIDTKSKYIQQKFDYIKKFEEDLVK